MKNTIIVSTRSEKKFNSDGQHDCAGTWTLAPAVKNERAQIELAENVEYLVHKRDGEIHAAYKVVGFHTERRDTVHRQGTPVTPQPKNSVGIRFHLRTVTDAYEGYLMNEAEKFNAENVIQGCALITT